MQAPRPPQSQQERLEHLEKENRQLQPTIRMLETPIDCSKV